jgi:tryptophan halogenase
MKKKIVIVGGGAAGWLSALYVQKLYKDSADIILIESEDIGILGAGEGSVPSFIGFLTELGINTYDFILKTNSTHKIGIDFKNWNGDGKSYLHDFYSTDIGLNPTAEFEYLGYLMSKDMDINEHMLAKKLAYSNMAPLSNTNNELVSHSFHFDAHLVADYLKNIALERGVIRIEGIINGFGQDVYGNVKTIKLENNIIDNIHFVFDCSGFAKLIIGKLYNTEWISYEDKLTVNSALPFQLPKDEGHIKPYTKAVAMKYGWMWQIPLQNRWGCGYVFDDNYINSDEAKKEVEQFLGHSIENNRTIKFKAGRYKNIWVKNCIAIGLSSGFIEPLEATAINMATLLLKLLNKFDIDYVNSTTIGNYNLEYGLVTDDIVDFLQFHYITKRNDTPFWEFYKSDKMKKSKALSMNLEKLKNDLTIFMPTNQTSIFVDKSWTTVGYGTEYLNKKLFIDKFNKVKDNENTIREFDYLNKITTDAIKKLTISELDFINKLKKEYGKS